MFATRLLFAFSLCSKCTHLMLILASSSECVYFSVSVALDVIRLFLNFFTLSLCVCAHFFPMIYRWLENASKDDKKLELHLCWRIDAGKMWRLYFIVYELIKASTHQNAMQALSKHKPLSGTANSTFNRDYNRELNGVVIVR